EALYEEYWRRFDDPFWRQEVRQGRLTRPRSDLYMQHFLASRQCIDIPVKHLYVEYKFWIERKRPFSTIREELATLAKQGDDFRRILDPKREDILFDLVTFIDCFDVRTTYPLLLSLLDRNIPDNDWKLITIIVQSYLLRRAICGFTTKNYNRIFLSLTRSLCNSEATPQKICEHLSGLVGESTEWPSDSKFAEAWKNRHAYETLQNARIVYILRRLNDTYIDSRTESITIESPLTVEHILPQKWIEHWQLPDGSMGLTFLELFDKPPGDIQVDATRRRNSLLQTLGNLTILTQPLNSSVSNSSWEVKKPALLQASLLPINQQLVTYEDWNEETIEIRSKDLVARALKLWPGPDRTRG
ncbi:MAG TPA: HNH endonuclease family protein, partial [Candidatus Hodarchaeales archaeon]|nr:HNH endonuclease family protein [Candidatus Hodarchaeales archaeon]